MGEPKAIKVCLVNRGEDSETPWAHDLGPAPGPRGSRKVKLVNVPFLHAKPTWGDIVIVSPVEDGLPTWDRDAVPWSKIGTRILEDGGRWAMIVDYREGSPNAFKTLAHACAELDVVCEGAWAPRRGEPGRVYLAVKNGTSDSAVMNHLERTVTNVDLDQVHPKPSKPRPSAVALAPLEAPTAAAPKAAAPKAKPAAPKSPAAAKTGVAKPAKSTAAKSKRAKPAAKPTRKR